MELPPAISGTSDKYLQKRLLCVVLGRGFNRSRNPMACKSIAKSRDDEGKKNMQMGMYVGIPFIPIKLWEGALHSCLYRIHPYHPSIIYTHHPACHVPGIGVGHVDRLKPEWSEMPRKFEDFPY